MTEMIRLNALKPGETGKVNGLFLSEDMKKRLQDMGFIKGTKVECAYRSPFGDPSAYFIKGTLIAIRCEDAERIGVEWNGAE